MGKTNSKSAVTHNADPQIRIVNNQELHGEILENSEVLIYVILVLVVIHLSITLYKILMKKERRRALRYAKSIEELPKV